MKTSPVFEASDIVALDRLIDRAHAAGDNFRTLLKQAQASGDSCTYKAVWEEWSKVMDLALDLDRVKHVYQEVIGSDLD